MGPVYDHGRSVSEAGFVGELETTLALDVEAAIVLFVEADLTPDGDTAVPKVNPGEEGAALTRLIRPRLKKKSDDMIIDSVC